MLKSKSRARTFISTKIAFVLVLTILLTELIIPAQSSKSENFKYLEKANKAFAEIIKKAKPAVVTIATTKRVKVKDPFEKFRKQLPRGFSFPFPETPQGKQELHGLGSGVIVKEDGHILTNNHVVKNAEEITVILPKDSREFDAEVVGKDPKTDLAVVKIDGEDLPTLPLGNSDKLQVGEWVVAIGSPFGFTQTVSRGAVSAKGRGLSEVQVLDPQYGYGNFIQTDASINKGNSGGALINIYGELVGLNTAIIGGATGTNVGVGFAISINLAKEIMNQLIEKGKVERAWLGVWIQPLTYELTQKLGLKSTKGALVAEVNEGSPAEEAGFKTQDVIVEFDGIKIKSSNHLRNIVSTSKIGKEVDVKIIRDGEEKVLEVKLGELPEKVASKGHPEAGTYTSSDFGLSVQNLTEELAKKLGYEGAEGVIITEVESGGPADDEGLKRGDLIQEVENKPVKNVKEYEEQIEKLESDSVMLRVRHSSGRAGYYVLKK